MDISPANQSQLLVELASHFVQILGWPTVVIGAWKVRGWLIEMEENFAQKLDTITSNHLHHIQEAMEANADAMKNVAIELRELRSDIRDLRLQK